MPDLPQKPLTLEQEVELIANTPPVQRAIKKKHEYKQSNPDDFSFRNKIFKSNPMKLTFEDFEQTYNDNYQEMFQDPPSVASDMSIDSARVKNMGDVYEMQMNMALKTNKYATVDRKEEIEAKYTGQMNSMIDDLKLIEKYKKEPENVKEY